MTRTRLIAGVLAVLAGTSAILLAACTSTAALPLPTPPKSAVQRMHKEDTDRAGIPVRLRIPSIGVDARVVPVGLTVDGDMGAPEAWEDLGWYQAGPRPGETGSAVIDGHLDSYTDTAVFWRLKELKKGDDVLVTDESGTTRTFRVVATKTYGIGDRNASAELFGTAGEQRLNLITCGGTWNARTQEYSQRLAVFTQLVSDTQES